MWVTIFLHSREVDLNNLSAGLFLFFSFYSNNFQLYSGAHEFTPGFSVGFVLLDLWFYVYVLWIVVCSFVLFLLAIVLSVLLRYTDSIKFVLNNGRNKFSFSCTCGLRYFSTLES
jgi:uncharacterized membrane protein